MGTKVHHKGYLPEYYTMRDLNKDASNSWPSCFEDRTLSGTFHNGFSQRHANGYAKYDKEVLKQTMLRHEEIFRKQVCELHRLYRVQRDLMDELKRKEEHNFCVQVHSSGSSLFSSKLLPKDGQKPWQGDGVRSTNASCSRTTLSDVDNAQAHLKLLNGSSSQTGLVSRENGCSRGVDRLADSDIKKFPRGMLDLQLPADTYIDNEDAEHTKEKKIIKPLLGTAHPANINFGFLPEDDVKLTLGSSENNGNKTQRSWLPDNLVDLNEPLREVSCEEVVVSSCNFPVQMTNLEGHQEHQNSMRSASEFLGFHKLLQDRYKSGEGSVLLNVDRGEKGWDYPLFKNEFRQSGNHVNYFTSNFSTTNARSSSEQVEIKTKNGQDFPSILSSKQKETELSSREKPSHIEVSDSSCIANTRYLGLAVPTMSGPFSAPPQSDKARSTSSLFSDSISHTPVAVQALSCFSESTMSIQSRSGSTYCQNHGHRSTPSKGGEAHFCPNGFHHSFRSESSAASHVYLPSITFDKPNLNDGVSSAYEKPECGLQKCLKGLHGTDVKTVDDMNLDRAPPSGFQIEYAPEQQIPSDVQGKREIITGGISWLRTKSPGSELLNINNGVHREEMGVEPGYSPPTLDYPTRWEIDKKKESEDIPSLDVMPLTFRTKGTIVQQQEACVTSNIRRILGLTVPEKTQYPPVDSVKNVVKKKSLHADISFHSKLVDLEKKIHTELDLDKSVVKCPNGFREHIRFNSCPTSMDQWKSSEHTFKDEVQLPSPFSFQDTAPRFGSEIDLEAPLASLAEERMPSAESALDLNQLVSPVEPGSEDTLQHTDFGDATIVRMAAETIHMMSLDKCARPEGVAVSMCPPALVDIFNWFADVVTSNSDDLGNVLETPRGEAEQGSSDIDGMDYFEYMTLNLKEVKVNECCSKPSDRENPEEEESGVAHLLLTKPRRGQGRRRRQRRDFQKDILPGLASLSRHEVTEDLQIIGGLMRASGQSWQAGGSRRNNSRSRSQSQRRGRGRLRGTSCAAAAVVELPLAPDPRLSNNAEIKTNGRSIVGWGRTTRRCWRQRCSSGNILVPPPM